MPEIVNIAEESKKYENEWLLFEVTKLNEQDWPVKGRLLCHSKNRDEIHEVAMRHPESELQYLYTGDPAPAEMNVVL
ncbi:MAG: hypothetical protein ACYSU0_08155 [Planctomycetota bacterium]